MSSWTGPYRCFSYTVCRDSERSAEPLPDLLGMLSWQRSWALSRKPPPPKPMIQENKTKREDRSVILLWSQGSMSRLSFLWGGSSSGKGENHSSTSDTGCCICPGSVLSETTRGMKPLRSSVAPETSVVGDLKFGLVNPISGNSWGCLNVQSWLRALA